MYRESLWDGVQDLDSAADVTHTHTHIHTHIHIHTSLKSSQALETLITYIEYWKVMNFIGVILFT